MVFESRHLSVGCVGCVSCVGCVCSSGCDVGNDNSTGWRSGVVGYLLRLDKLVGEEGRTESQEEGEAFADLGAALSGHVWRVYGEGWGCGLARCCIVFHSLFSVCFIQ